MKLEIKIEEIYPQIENLKEKEFIIQIPEGLKIRTLDIINNLKSRFPDREFYILVDPCYGACDLAINSADALGIKTILHFGHRKILEKKNVLYVPVEYKISEDELERVANDIYKEIKKQNLEKILLVASSPYISYIDEIAKKIKEKEINVMIPEGSERARERGLILGCNYEVIKNISNIDSILLISDAEFHAIGLSLSTNKKIIYYDMIENKIIDLEKKRELFLRKRFAQIALAKEAKIFGILISTKIGQKRKDLAIQIKKELFKRNRETIMLVADYILPEYLEGIKVDCFINTACPRIAFESERWKKPIINPNELEIVLDIRKWEDYNMEQIL
ncbi:MAG: diphthamide biosynthesis enzyme Dph2 [Candidatus Diapherotrites archaeon]|nr:diphthamide biosynthesis enzyme Dph2 [Candidatus Diapherotrites archaeon]